MRAGEKLRVDVRSSQVTPLIGVFDMFSASLTAQHYGDMFVSGFGFAASYYGLPDIGFIAWPDMVNFVQRLRVAFPHQHLLVDIDDGYVDPEVACHVVEHLGKLNLVLQTRDELLVVARTDATEESEILHRAEALAATDADILLVDGLRSVDWIRKIRGVIGAKPLLFNQIAGGKSPRLSLTELEDLGVNATIYSTPCLFAAQTAIDNALLELRAIDVAACTALLERNISRHHKKRETAEV